MEDLLKKEYRNEMKKDVYCDDDSGSYTDDYVYWLENKLNNLLKPDVIGSVCDCGANGCLITVCSRCCRNYTGAA